MPSWEVYRLSCEPTSKERRELGIESPVVITDDFMREIGKTVNAELSRNPNEIGELGIFTVVIEGYWYFNGKPVVFIDTADLVRGLYETNYRIDFNSIRLPFDVVSFSFPDDVEIEGMKLPPVIFNRVATSSGATRITSIIREKFGACSMVSVCNQEHLEHALEGRPDDTVPIKEDYKISLTDKEARLHSIMFRLCVGLSTYMSVFPQSLRKGFPEAMRTRDSRIYKIDFDRVSPVTLGLHEQFRNSPSAHFRSGHFRTLVDDRYRRNPDGTYRTVWVSEAYVAGHIDPHTVVEDKKEE